MTSSGDQAATAARLGVAAQLLGFEVQGLVEHVVSASDGLRNLTVFTDANVRTIGIGGELPDDEWTARRVTQLAKDVSPSKALARAGVIRQGSRWVEASLGVATLAIEGMASLDDETAIARTLGFDEAVVAALDRRLRHLSAGGERRRRLLRTTVSSEPDRIELGVEVPVDVTTHIAELAGELGIGAAQLKLVTNVHKILAGDRSVWVRCGARPHAVEEGVTITYSNVKLENCVRVVNGLSTNEDAVQRWGTLVGALASTEVQLVELTLGPADPMPARFGLHVRA